MKRRHEQKIRGWLPQPNEPRVNFHKFVESNSSGLGKISASFISLGLFFWSLASYLFIFSKYELDQFGLSAQILSPYWIFSLVLFVAGIGLISFPLISILKENTKERVGKVVLGTSLVAIGVYLAFALTIQDIGRDFILAPIAGFPVVMSVLVGALFIGFGSKIVSLSFRQ